MGLLEDIIEQQRQILQRLDALPAQGSVQETDGFIGIEAAGKLLGVGVDTMRRKCQKRIIPFYQETPRSPQLFKRSEVIAYQEAHRKHTATEASKATLQKVHTRRTAR